MDQEPLEAATTTTLVQYQYEFNRLQVCTKGFVSVLWNEYIANINMALVAESLPNNFHSDMDEIVIDIILGIWSLASCPSVPLQN